MGMEATKTPTIATWCAHDALVALSELKPNPRNPNKHPKGQIQLLAKIIREQGWRNPIVVSTRSGLITRGHGRLEAARLLKAGSVPVDFQDYSSEEEELADAIADNRIAELAEIDEPMLRQLIEQLDQSDFDIELAGFDDKAIADLMAETAPENDADAEPQIDKAAELAAKWNVERGQVWELGAHRLMCGDSANTSDVSKIVTDTASLCFTSPPYANQRDYDAKQGAGDWNRLMQGVFSVLPMKEDGQLLVNLGIAYREGNWLDYWTPWTIWMEEKGWRRFGWYVWDKISAPPGDWCGRCGPAHEWIFHFNRKSREVNHIIPKKAESIKLKTGSSLRHKDGTIHTANYSPESGLNTHKIPDSVWRFNTARTGGKVEVNHPAVFPVELPRFAIQSFTKPNEIVYEPFAGSGTTIIACEQSGRRCRAMEISANYAAITLQRFLDATGKKPRLLVDTAEKTRPVRPRLAQAVPPRLLNGDTKPAACSSRQSNGNKSGSGRSRTFSPDSTTENQSPRASKRSSTATKKPSTAAALASISSPSSPAKTAAPLSNA